jgi:hypothetical protein
MDLERVSQLGGKERARLRAKVVERYPSFAKYQERGTRELPVRVLRPTS